jgi:sRNA-binding regulator protein Hfq
VIEQFLLELHKSRVRINIFLKNGVKLNGKVLSYSLEERAVVIDGISNNSTVQVLVFLDSVATIVAGESSAVTHA